MNWLFQNPLGNMYGPHFLILYATIIAIVLVFYYFLVRGADATGERTELPVPEDIDPYEVAFLRGGENEVARLAVFELMERKLIRIEKQKTGIFSRENVFVRNEGDADPADLSPLARTALDWFTKPRRSSEVFELSPLPTLAVEYSAGYRQRAEQESLLQSPEVQSRVLRLALFFGLFIALPGIYKLIVALVTGHFNVIFLILLSIVGLIALVAMTPRHRLSRRGRTFLAAMQSHHDTFPIGLASVGLFGVGVLAGTAYGEFNDMFKKASGSGGCGGSGCGGGGCGGGGCGGGCGGCGGD